MDRLSRYMTRLVWLRVLMVLAGLLGLFAVFEMVGELDRMGRGGFGFSAALQATLYRLPALSVELMPIACLIGGLWAFAELAGESEFTAARAAGYGPLRALSALLVMGLPFALATAAVSEWVVPWSEGESARVKAIALGASGRNALKSGYWLRDPAGVLGGSVSERMANFSNVLPDQSLEQVVVYEFDQERRLQRVLRARRAVVEGAPSPAGSMWRLGTVEGLVFSLDGAVSRFEASETVLESTLTPSAVSALRVKPDQMSARDLYATSSFLREARQQSVRYEMAFWKKMLYPWTVWVMLFLALPAAYVKGRSGSLGLKLGLGIAAGLGFHLVNSLFSHLGLLAAWPPVLVVFLPSLGALLFAASLFSWVQRRGL
ncbi:MAG: Lipopolysaccharide export system permease protein lptG [Pseudomonadota bacterium]